MENDTIFSGGLKSKLLLGAAAVVGLVLIIRFWVHKQAGITTTPAATAGTAGVTPTRSSDLTLTVLVPGGIPTQGDTVIGTPSATNNNGQPVFTAANSLPANLNPWGPPAPYVGPAGQNLRTGYAAHAVTLNPATGQPLTDAWYTRTPLN